MGQQFTLAMLVGIGGAAGSLCRYGISLLLQRFAVMWPAGTLSANMLGCFVIGVVTALAERGGVGPEVRLALATGFCGGFTTMSSMVYEAAGMLRAGDYGAGSAYVGATLVLSLAMFIAGSTLLRVVIR